MWMGLRGEKTKEKGKRGKEMGKKRERKGKEKGGKRTAARRREAALLLAMNQAVQESRHSNR